MRRHDETERTQFGRDATRQCLPPGCVSVLLGPLRLVVSPPHRVLPIYAHPVYYDLYMYNVLHVVVHVVVHVVIILK